MSTQETGASHNSVVICPACGGTDLSQVATWTDWVAACGRRDDGPMRLAAADACGVAARAPCLMECLVCRSVTMDPIPGPKEIAGFYSNYHATDDWVIKAPKKVNRAFKRILPFRLRTGGRFLEVGASIGTAAEAARRLGFKATAQEIDPDAVAKGRTLYPGVEFVEGFMEDMSTREPFDMIYCAEVIEHVPSPIDFVKSLYALLRQGGWLYLTTPDAGHKKRPENITEWKSTKPPEHIVLFTQEGLRQCFDRGGFLEPRFMSYSKPGVRMVTRRPA